MTSPIVDKKNHFSALPSEPSGFTLIELLVTVAIFVLITGLAFPKLESFSRTYLLKSTAQNVAALMQYAQGLAISKKNFYKLNFNETQYWLTQQDPAKNSYISIKGRLGRMQTIAPVLGIQSSSEVVFQPDGIISPARVYVCLKEQCYTVSTQELSGQVSIYDFKLEEDLLEEEKSLSGSDAS